MHTQANQPNSGIQETSGGKHELTKIKRWHYPRQGAIKLLSLHNAYTHLRVIVNQKLLKNSWREYLRNWKFSRYSEKLQLQLFWNRVIELDPVNALSIINLYTIIKRTLHNVTCAYPRAFCLKRGVTNLEVPTQIIEFCWRSRRYSNHCHIS